MKKIAAILFLLCLVVPFLGTFAWLKYHTQVVKCEVRRMIEAGIGREELTQLSFSKKTAGTTLNWESADEFEYSGQMYDVAFAEENGDSVRYWCHADNEETALNKQVSQLIVQILGENPQRKENQQQLNHFFSNLFCSEAFQWRTLFFPEGRLNLSEQHFAYATIEHTPDAPPPELA